MSLRVATLTVALAAMAAVAVPAVGVPAVAVPAVAMPVPAADRVGVYSILEHVVLEPANTSPQRVQLWGAFVVADARGDAYGPATRGYMYFNCPPRKAEACTLEWGDLKWFGGTGKGVGFGSRGQPAGRVRQDTEPLASPDVYPLKGGVVKMESKDPSFVDLVARLKAALVK
jgi:hypothetical protein